MTGAAPKLRIIQPPLKSVLEIIPDGGFVLRFSRLQYPNWFHRTAVRLLLGWVWRRPTADDIVQYNQGDV